MEKRKCNVQPFYYIAGQAGLAMPLTFCRRPSVGQSFGFASELLLGPELALLLMNHREFLAKPSLPEGRFEK